MEKARADGRLEIKEANGGQITEGFEGQDKDFKFSSNYNRIVLKALNPEC